MTDDEQSNGLDRAYGDAPADGRRETGDPAAPAAAATDTLNDLQLAEAAARSAQADRAAGADENGRGGDDAAGDDGDARRKRAYAIWEREGRPEGRHQAHWDAADVPEPGTAPWTEGP